jgi:putative redox protein
MNKQDSIYAGTVIAGWASRYVGLPDPDTLKTNHDVVASLDGDNGFTTQMKLGDHYMTADEPENFGGNNFGPTPYQLVSAGLSACTVMTIQMYARRKGWKIRNIEVHTSYDKEHAVDCEACDVDSAKIDTFHRAISIDSDLDDKQIARILQIADKCPVHKTLHSETQVVTKLIE